MEAIGEQIAILTDNENIIYPGNKSGGAGILGVAANNPIAILSFINNDFKSICCKAGFYKIFFLLNLFLWLGLFKTQAQQDANYALHANIIYRFTKYIDWPNSSGDFVIGIVGNTPLYDELESFIANKTVGNRKIVIKKMSSSADSYNCQMLFISQDKSKSLKKIAIITKGSPILIISETSADALNGSCINFVIVNEHLKLEINKNNIEQRNLSIASELLSLGTIVQN